jgi:hypothetical protein
MLATAVLLVGLSPATGDAITRYVNPDGVCGGNLPCYTTIQAAIDASSPSDIIELSAGIHSPAAEVLVHTSVEIRGPQAGQNPLPSQASPRIPGDVSTEAIIDGTAGGLSGIIRITASNVKLDGLEVRNGSGDLINSLAAIATSGTVIKHCIIHDSSGDEGIQLRNVDGPLVTCNYVYETRGDGINNCCGTVDAEIKFNELHNIGSSDGAIYIYDATNTTIEGNLVWGTDVNDGIKLGSKNGADAAGTGGHIYNNTVRNTAQDGISVYMSDTVVECNEVFGSGSENGAIYVAWAVSNVDIIHNDVHDNLLDISKWTDPGAIMIGADPVATTITVADNNIWNNTPNGCTNKAVGLLTATNNWWGAADGPSGAGAGSGDAVSTNVAFNPWLVATATRDCPEVGDCSGPPVQNRTSTWGKIKSTYR